MNILHFHGNHHLGDTMFAFIVIYNIKDYLEQNDTTVYFYMNNENIDQMSDFKPVKGMQIFDISCKPQNSIEIWDCNDWIFEPNGRNGKQHSGLSQNEFYVKYFNVKLRELKIPININTFCYEDEELLYRYDNLPEKYKNIDILFINSIPCSGQYVYDENNLNMGIKVLDEKYKIVTTKKVNNILCTRDNELKIKDIAAISTNVKVVIAINTGPIVPLYNKFTLMNVKKFYIFSDTTYYSYPNFEMKKFLRDISLEELDYYIH
jgi:hypothetical protein